jgi:hypothetical protein
MKAWMTAIVLGSISAAAVVATYMRSPEPDFVGAIMDYNLTFYYPLILLACVCWVTALCFYVVFIRQSAYRSAMRIIVPLILLLPFIYESIIIVRHFLWLQRFV